MLGLTVLKRSVQPAARLAGAMNSAAARRGLRLSAISRNAGDAELGPRDSMAYDVVIVGGGPAGLSAAIRLKQLSAERGTDLSVCVVEKGGELGAHILSGNVFEPRALNELFPEWRSMGAPVETPVTEDRFLLLTSETTSIRLPNMLLPPYLHNEGNYIISLSKLVRWLGERAEELGVELFPGFSASEVLYDAAGHVRGIATADVGRNKDGSPKDSFARGMELHARQTLFGEGCRGSCSEEVMHKFNLREGVQPQTYGLGLKEVWEVPEGTFVPGLVQHSLGWPLQNSAFAKTFGGSFLYHLAPNMVLAGFVVGLDYANPYLSPYEEFQRWKHHPEIASHLEGGKCVQYGARTLNEGGYHAIPKLTFPGGALIGCSAGFLNAVKIKGTHTAMKSGMLAAESVYDALTSDDNTPTVAAAGEIPEGTEALTVSAYQSAFENSWIASELKVVRNCHAAFHSGILPGVVYTGAATFLTKGKEPWTLPNTQMDSEKTEPASQHKPIAYPKADNKLSFDLLTNLARSGTNHEDQPSHLKIKPELAHVPVSVSMQEFAAPETRFCPARVYEYTEDNKLVINSQNCLHCKACSIKTPQQYIQWTTPEGGGGPAYSVM